MIGNLILAVSTALFSGVLALGEYNALQPKDINIVNPSTVTYKNEEILIVSQTILEIKDLTAHDGFNYIYDIENGLFSSTSSSNIFNLQFIDTLIDNNTTFGVSYLYDSENNYIDFIPFWNVNQYTYIYNGYSIVNYNMNMLIACSCDNLNDIDFNAYLSYNYGNTFEQGVYDIIDEQEATFDIRSYLQYECQYFTGETTFSFCPYVFRISSDQLSTNHCKFYFKSYVIINSSEYNLGYSTGYKDGNTTGYSDGYNNGYTDGLSLAQQGNFNSLFNSIADTPLRFLYGLFNFNLFGTSMIIIILSLLTGIVVIHLVKKFWK